MIGVILEKSFLSGFQGLKKLGLVRIEPEELGETSCGVITLSSVRSHGRAEAVAWR